MQKFTRALTREIEVAGERLAVTFSGEGMTLRPVGSRRPPHTMSWQALVHACVQAHGSGQQPGAEEVGEAVKALKGERGSRPRRTAEKEKPEDPAPAGAGQAGGHAAGRPLPDLLSRLDHWLEAHRARYRHGLLAGASAADLDALQSALGRYHPGDRVRVGWSDPTGATHSATVTLAKGPVG